MGEQSLWLFTIEEFNQLPNGFVLECIDTTFSEKGIDDIDMDTRHGHIAFGVRDPYNHKERNLLMTFLLKGA